METIKQRGEKLYREGQAIVDRMPGLNPIDDYDPGWKSYPKRMFVWGLLNTIFLENGGEAPMAKLNAPHLANTLGWYGQAQEFEASADWGDYWE